MQLAAASLACTMLGWLTPAIREHSLCKRCSCLSVSTTATPFFTSSLAATGVSPSHARCTWGWIRMWGGGWVGLRSSHECLTAQHSEHTRKAPTHLAKAARPQVALQLQIFKRYYAAVQGRPVLLRAGGSNSIGGGGGKGAATATEQQACFV